ncbi:MAG: hypothetical protein ABI469_02170 [Gemmatimonadales bacterium]
MPDREGGMFGYRYDAFDTAAVVSSDKMFPLDAMLDQARRMRRALGPDDSWPGLLGEFPALLELTTALSSEGQRARVARMYGRYADETLSFAEAISKGARHASNAATS